MAHQKARRLDSEGSLSLGFTLKVVHPQVSRLASECCPSLGSTVKVDHQQAPHQKVSIFRTVVLTGKEFHQQPIRRVWWVQAGTKGLNKIKQKFLQSYSVIRSR